MKRTHEEKFAYKYSTFGQEFNITTEKTDQAIIYKINK